jgi:hypothetical protein
MRNKIVKLTESDLVRLVKKIVKEQELDRPVKYFDDRQALKDFDKNKVLVVKGNSEIVEKVLNNLPKTIKMLSFYNCELADFKNIDLCEFPNLGLVTLLGTPNNFKIYQGDCFDDGDDTELYNRIKGD